MRDARATAFPTGWRRKTVDEILQTVSRQYFRVAHASRVLVSASRRNNLFLQKSALARRQRQHARRVRYPIKIEGRAAAPPDSTSLTEIVSTSLFVRFNNPANTPPGPSSMKKSQPRPIMPSMQSTQRTVPVT